MPKPRNPIDIKTLKKYELERIRQKLLAKPFKTNPPKDYSVLKLLSICLGCVIIFSIVILLWV